MSNMDGNRLKNPLLEYFMDQEMGPFCKDRNKLYDVVLPRLPNTEGIGIIYGTSGDMDHSYICGIDPYSFDNTNFVVSIYKRDKDGIVKYFKSNKDAE